MGVGVTVAATGVCFGFVGGCATVGVGEGKIIEVGDGVGCIAERDCDREIELSGVGVRIEVGDDTASDTTVLESFAPTSFVIAVMCGSSEVPQAVTAITISRAEVQLMCRGSATP